ncbi:MAG: hypothetical protein RLZZ175_1828 [Bacteroidota bacterium]|jgi:hypothetical protein
MSYPFYLKIFLLFLPFLFIITVNETLRLNNNYSQKINPSIENPNKCSWTCHNNTTYCKKNHVKMNKNDLVKTESIYWGIISLLKSTGNYKIANLILFLVFFPISIWLLIINILSAQNKIKKISNAII